MWRPAVANVSRARAGKTRGLDIGGAAPVAGRNLKSSLRRDRSPKCPGGGRSSTTARKQRYRRGGGGAGGGGGGGGWGRRLFRWDAAQEAGDACLNGPCVLPGETPVTRFAPS